MYYFFHLALSSQSCTVTFFSLPPHFVQFVQHLFSVYNLETSLRRQTEIMSEPSPTLWVRLGICGM
jgi:hypothetical protein